MDFKIRITITIKMPIHIGNHIGEVTHHQLHFATIPISHNFNTKNTMNINVNNEMDDFELFDDIFFIIFT